ncbi:ADP-heptose--LPS heptosyltransferase [Desulfosarcina alkanivorans]|uniref:ADP-heptose--LPS heptosyltransferase n=2 Tax=Desulfosarcina alkanivorans TaxID=571177 RepID=A0A5K7YHA1_9BACT|nr:ADP-heptose--LPS heptosyltransferase [Desulfosarcina alkanivorans]
MKKNDKNLIEKFLRFGTHLKDEIFSCMPTRKSRVIYKKIPKNILVIFPHGIGNMVLFTPVLENLKINFPDSFIILLLAPRNTKEVITDSRLFDTIIEYDKNQKNSSQLFFDIVKIFKNANIDLGLSFSMSAEFPRLMSLSKVKYRIGFKYNYRKLKDVNYLLHKSVLSDSNKHEVLNYLSVLKLIGITDFIIKPCFYFKKNLPYTVREKLKNDGLNYKKNVVGFHTGSFLDMIEKRWPPENFAKLGNLLTKNFSVQIVIVGGEEEKNYINKIIDKMDGYVKNLAGTLNLKETAALISTMKLFVSNDSGPMHIAAGVGTPVIGIFGPTNEIKNSPWAHENQIVKVIRHPMNCAPCYIPYSGKISCKNNKCLRSITPEDVFSKCEDILFNTE